MYVLAKRENWKFNVKVEFDNFPINYFSHKSERALRINFINFISDVNYHSLLHFA